MDRQRRLRRIFYLCNQIGLDRSDRLELSREVLRVPDGIQSYSDLDDDDLSDIDLILTSYKVIRELLVANGTAEFESKIMLRKIAETRATGKYLSNAEAQDLIEAEESENTPDSDSEMSEEASEERKQDS